MSDELRATLAFVLTGKIGSVRYRRLVEHFGGAVEALRAPAEELAKAMEAPSGLAAKIRDTLAPDRVDAEIERAAADGVRLIGAWEETYPDLLKEAYGPPVLYVKGEPACLHMPGVAVVGTRRPTPYGREHGRRFASRLAEAGLLVVSGLARGVDSEAHRGALVVGGLTVAVFGCGLGTIYPKENERLAEEIVAGGGALISELPMDFPVRAENFPRRNRIISGLALGTLVIEASNRSGALITARNAAEQGRDVFVLPGPVGSLQSMGANALIRDGGRLVTCAEDILSELRLEPGALEKSRRLTGAAVPPASDAAPQDAPDETSRRILDALGRSTRGTEDIARSTGLVAPEVAACLVKLELSGRVRRLPGGYAKAP